MDESILKNVQGFEWDEANVTHISRHNVLPNETEEPFFDKDFVLDEDLEHSSTEKRFLIIGKTQKGRLLYQIFTIRKAKIRIISSRDINRKEVVLYEKETNRSKI